MKRYEPEIERWPTESDGRLPVSELFVSVQGEGRFAGTPALFIRFKYCNLGCVWCDTRFTWDKRKIEPGELLSLAELTERSCRLVDAETRAQTHVVLTGGEPMLHQAEIPALVKSLREVGFRFVEIETNGMYAPNDELSDEVDWWNCSPKLTNNGLAREVNIIPSAIKSLVATGKVDFKFVVQSPEDISELIEDYLPLVPRESVILMPEGVTRERQLAQTGWVMQACVAHGFRFSPRLHILAYGNERGK